MSSPSLPHSEWLTRKQLIDPKLISAGWKIVPFVPGAPLSSYERCAVAEFETANGPADYALCVGGQVLGIVEAKKLTLGPQSVLTQAERYSKGAITSSLAFGEYRVPFLYSTNGEIVWHADVRNSLNRSHSIARFHTPDALAERLTADSDAACQRLLHTPNDHPRLRPYQREANAAIERAISDRKQQMLVAMATGTGKTFTMVNEVYRLMKSEAALDVLISKDGTIGRVSVVPPNLAGGNITQHLVRAAIHRFVDIWYAVAAIRSPYSQEWLVGELKGVALQGVNVRDFRRLPIPLPPVNEQREIAHRLEHLFVLADDVEQRVNDATRQADKLTQSILAKAFRRELVPTEAELARREGREYEPASMLLERIRAEREAATQPTRRTRSSRKKIAKAGS